jgi:hypothetical protein
MDEDYIIDASGTPRDIVRIPASLGEVSKVRGVRIIVRAKRERTEKLEGR